MRALDECCLLGSSVVRFGLSHCSEACMAKKQIAAASGNGVLSFWNILFAVTMTGVGFAAGAAYGRHTVMVAPSADAVAAGSLPIDDDTQERIPDDTFSAFDRIPDARGRRVAREGSAAVQVVLAPGADVAAAGDPEGSADVRAALPPATEVAAMEPVAAPSKPAPAVAPPAPARAEQMLANSAAPSGSSLRKVGRASSQTPSFEIVAAGARTWEEANEASRSLQDGGLKTTVSAVRDERGGQRWLVHVQGSGDGSEKKRQEQLIRRLLSSR
jgi:hypothetical protein